MTHVRLLALVAQRKEERCALVCYGFCPDSAAVMVDQSLREGESDTTAFVPTCTAQAVKRGKQFVRVLHVETNAVVLDVDRVLAVVRQRPHLYHCGRSRAREFEGVAQQIQQYLMQQRGVGSALGQFAEHELHVAFATIGFKLFQTFINGLLERDTLPAHGRAR